MNWKGVQQGNDNREAVRRFFRDHLCATNRECSAALGLSVEAVGRHVKAIRAEWQEGKVDADQLRVSRRGSRSRRDQQAGAV